ncbi:hypothetical protein MTO96_040453 [Rhipicephalus appendiculatus]
MSNKVVPVFIALFINTVASQVCRPLSIEACYGSIATSLLRDLVKPPFGEIEQDSSIQQICERRLPRVSRCISMVNDCPKEQRANFSHLENAYRGFHSVICTQESFDGLRDLWDCLDRQRRKKCDKDTDELLGASESSLRLHCQMARNYSVCLEEVTKGCPSKFDNGRKALKTITDGAVETLCSPRKNFQSISSEVPPSVTDRNEHSSNLNLTSTALLTPTTALRAVSTTPTTSSQWEESTTPFADLVKHEQASQGHYDNNTPVPSMFNKSATASSERPPSSATPDISMNSSTSGDATLCVTEAEYSGNKCNNSNVEEQSHIAPSSSSTRVLTIACIHYAFAFMCFRLALVNI